MAINFPSNPSNGQQVTLAGTTYTYNSAKTKWEIRNLFTSSVFDSAEVVSLVDSSYVSSRQEAAGVTVYANRSSLPASGNTAGDQAYVTANNRLYIWNGSGWYNIALLNLAPSIQSVLDSDNNTTPFSLATDGTPTTITITATDSDGDPITYGYSADSNFSGLATLSQANNVFTITPFSQDSATTSSGTITFTATDNVNVASSGVQTFTLNFLSPLWDETMLNIGTSSTNSLDNSTFIDRSTNTYTITASGTSKQTSFHPYLDNWSIEFDGSGDYLTAPTSTDFSFNGDFTVESWIYFRSTSSSGHMCDFRLGSSAPSNNNIAIAYSSSTGTFVISIGSVNAVIGTTAVSTNQWYHVAAVRNSDTITLYVNGLSEDSVVNTNTFANYTNRPTLGAFGSGSANLNGFISDFRVVKGTALYTANFTPPSTKLTAVSGTSLLTCQSNRFIDNSTNAHTITVNGDPEVSAFNPFGQGSEYAVGENKGSSYFGGSAYLEPTSSTIGAFGNNDFTIEFWINPSSIGTDQVLVDCRPLNSNGNYMDVVLFSSGQIGTYVNLATRLSGGSLSANVWAHIAVVGTSSGTTLYINGSQVDTDSYTTSYISSASRPRIGVSGYHTGTQYGFSGYMSDIKIVEGTALYTSNFTPPTAPVGNTNASLYLPMDNAGIFDTTGNHNLTLYGNTSTSTTQTKFADTAIYFASSGDYLANLGGGMNINMNSFTIEGWIRPPDWLGNGTNPCFFAFNKSSDGSNILVYAALGLYYDGGSWTGTGLSNNVWSHVAVTYDGTTVKAYENGTQVISQTHSFSTSLNDCDFALGAEFDGGNGGSPGNYLSGGYIENFQIVNSVKYTTNFTPPTQTQGRVYQAED